MLMRLRLILPQQIGSRTCHHCRLECVGVATDATAQRELLARGWVFDMQRALIPLDGLPTGTARALRQVRLRDRRHLVINKKTVISIVNS